MKSWFLLLGLLFAGSILLHADLPSSHPLSHPNLVVIQRPLSLHVDGGIYLNQVAAYILGSDEERAAASIIIEREGYGPRGEHYLYSGAPEKPAVADSRPFRTRQEALAYLHAEGVKHATYLSTETSFPDSVPSDLVHCGIEFRLIEHRK